MPRPKRKLLIMWLFLLVAIAFLAYRVFMSPIEAKGTAQAKPEADRFELLAKRRAGFYMASVYPPKGNPDFSDSLENGTTTMFLAGAWDEIYFLRRINDHNGDNQLACWGRKSGKPVRKWAVVLKAGPEVKKPTAGGALQRYLASWGLTPKRRLSGEGRKAFLRKWPLAWYDREWVVPVLRRRFIDVSGAFHEDNLETEDSEPFRMPVTQWEREFLTGHDSRGTRLAS